MICLPKINYEMKVARAAVGITLPFVLGVVAVTISLPTLYNHLNVLYLACSACLLATIFTAFWSRISLLKVAKNRSILGLGSGWIFLGLCMLLAGATIALIAAIPTIHRSGEEAGFFQRIAQHFKDYIDSIPFEGEMTAGVVKAFLIGDRSGIPWEVRAAFRSAGASHLLALSGLHLSVIYMIVSWTLRIFGNSPIARQIRSGVILLFSAFFTLLTGAGPSIVRAFLFIGVRESSLLLHRRSSAINIFCVALILQLALDPSEITSVGFQLSYLAMLGIVLFFQPLDGLWGRFEMGLRRYMNRYSEVIYDYKEHPLGWAMHKIWSLCAVTLCCQIFTAPAVLLYFGTFPRYFLLTNLLCLPLSNLVIFLAVAVVALSAIGICPTILLSATDWAVDALIYVLRVISTL